MDVLTREYITNIASQDRPNQVVDPTSIAYIQHLVTPYAQAIEQTDSVDEAQQWLRRTFERELAVYANRKLLRANAIAATAGLDEPARLTAVSRAVIEYLAGELLEVGGNHARYLKDTTILPWDIKAGISGDSELDGVFKQKDDTDKLMVTITAGGNDFSHALSEDFVAGIQMYYLAERSNVTISLFGVPLTTTHLTNAGGARHDESVAREGPTKYLVSVDGVNISFRTPDFLQGAATAALWLNEDFHTRLTNLRTFNEMHLTF
jgi:hypothetical protein